MDNTFSSDGGAKPLISSYTKAYEETFASEYLAFLNMHKVKVKVQTTDNKHAKWHVDGEWRQWGEIPATLFALLKRTLTAEQWQWFQTTDGQRWFYTTHPQYKVAGGKL